MVTSPPDPDALSPQEFLRRLGGAVEHSPWVASRAWTHRPFGGVEGLAHAMRAEILAASPEEQLALLNAHPELAGREAAAGAMTSESTGEQGRLGLLALSAERLARLHHLNLAYRERFGFPLIVALRLHDTLDSVFTDATRRLGHDVDTERATALQQVCEVMRGRLTRVFEFPSPTTASTRKVTA